MVSCVFSEAVLYDSMLLPHCERDRNPGNEEETLLRATDSLNVSLETQSPSVALGALFGGAVAIAFAPIFVRLSFVGPTATAFWRLALALPVLWLWLFIEQRRGESESHRLVGNDYLWLSIAGLFFAGDLSVWHQSIQFTSVANSTLLANFAPIFVALGSWLLFAQRATSAFFLGMTVALVGTTMMVGASFQVSARHFFGDVLGLVTALFYAGYILTVKQLREKCSAATVMAIGGTASAGTLWLVAHVAGERLLPETAEGWTPLVALALLSQVTGQSLIAYALAHLPAAFSSVGLLLQPVMAAILAWLLLGETIGFWSMLGGGLVLVGIVLARRAS
jgi:drug/metabolite transporter (DMT)-like permease